MRVGRILCVALALSALSVVDILAQEVEIPIVLDGCSIVAEPGAAPIVGRIVIRGSTIVAVGADAVAPAGARTIDCSGLTAYAGFIDAFSRVGVSEEKLNAKDERRIEGDVPSITAGLQLEFPQGNRNGIFARRRVEDLIDIDAKTFGPLRESGFTLAQLAPPAAMISGGGSLILLGERPLRESVYYGGESLAASFQRPPRRALPIRGSYPASPLGVAASLRQFFLDAQWYRDELAYVAKHPQNATQTPYDPDLEEAQSAISGQRWVAFEADNADEIRRALDICAEFNLRPLIVGAREADQMLDRLKQQKAAVALSLRMPEEPKEFKIDAEQLRPKPGDDVFFGKNWGKRPFYPQVAYDQATQYRKQTLEVAQKIDAAGVPWMFTTATLDKEQDGFDSLKAIVKAGLNEAAALRALTTTPAKIFGVEAHLGRIAVGQTANLTLLSGPLAAEDAAVRKVVVAGREFSFGGESEKDKGKKDKKSGKGPRAKPTDANEPADANQPAGADESNEQDKNEAVTSEPASSTAPSSAPSQPGDDLLLSVPSWAIETDADRICKFKTGGSVLLKNATVLTVTKGAFENTSVLIRDGKIAEIAKDIAAPAGVTTIDLTGYVVMPGMFDPHSHIASSDVNEYSMSVTPEVRIRDVMEPRDPAIYRSLAGGTTAIHSMHGSANTIGGQNVLMKLKMGRAVEEMVMNDTRTVKFALGENVKRPGMQDFASRTESPRRFPGTRMGVESTLRRAMTAGQEYLAKREEYAKTRAANADVEPLRRDLRLEALADIVAGDIWINCHCYRADEILRLLAVAEDFGLRIGALHHVLEGYRIMPEIRRHGCGTATFADWWAYKIEAYDAVPQNAGMLLKAGINSAIKSDSSDLMRRLNTEASKCMKFSDLTPDEALSLVTINAARLFGLDGRLGSIEVGKDGDVAVFDGHPLDSFSKCVMTLIDGEAYFVHPDFDPTAPRAARIPLKRFVRTDFEPAKNGKTPVTANIRPERELKNARAYAITNATLHPVSGPAIENGTLLIEDGKITAIGKDVKIPAETETLNVGGQHVWPGLINAATNLGLYEIGQVSVTVDASDVGDYQPDSMAVSAVNPQSAMIEVTRAEGILTALVMPTSPTIAGQAGLIDLSGWTMPEMLIEPRVGLVVDLPGEPPDGLTKEPLPDPNDVNPDRPRGRRNRPAANEELRKLERELQEARAYAQGLRANQIQVRDPRLDALAPYVLGEKPTFFRVNSYKLILEALRFADRLSLKPVIVGGREAWKLADLLAARDVPVIYEGVFAIPGGLPDVPRMTEVWDANYRAASVMAKAGVRFCIAHFDADLAKLMPFDAGFSVAHGLDADAAIRAMTLTPAEILGVADRLGSLEVGKIANVIVSTDSPLQGTNRVTHVFIRGKPVDLSSKHTRDASRFGARPAPQLPPPRTDLRGPQSQSH